MKYNNLKYRIRRTYIEPRDKFIYEVDVLIKFWVVFRLWIALDRNGETAQPNNKGGWDTMLEAEALITRLKDRDNKKAIEGIVWSE